MTTCLPPCGEDEAARRCHLRLCPILPPTLPRVAASVLRGFLVVPLCPSAGLPHAPVRPAAQMPPAGTTLLPPRVAGQAARGIAQVGLESGVPTAFGLITADTLEQAVERAGAKAGNKGADAAASAIEMVNLVAQLPTGK